MHYRSWNAVPDKYKRSIYPTLHNYFDLDRFRDTPFWNGVMLGIEADCATSYRRRKHKLREHFNTVGGYNDVDKARKHPPPRHSEKAWKKVIDRLFTTEKYKCRSIKNAKNRAMHLYTSSHGSESYAQKRYKEVKETGKAKHIEGWRKSHFKDGQWCNIRAQNDWDKIQNEYKKMVEKAGGEEGAIDEVECLKRALGERHGHTRGVGRKVKDVPSYYVPSTSSNNESFNAMAQQLTQQLSQQFSQQLQQFQQMMMSQNPSYQHLQFSFDPSQVQVPPNQSHFDPSQVRDTNNDESDEEESQSESGEEESESGEEESQSESGEEESESDD